MSKRWKLTWVMFALMLIGMVAAGLTRALPPAGAQEPPSSTLQIGLNWPKDGDVLNRDFGIKGWAVDPSAGEGAGPGFNLVRVYRGDECAGEVIAETFSGNFRPDISEFFELDSSYDYNDFEFAFDNFPPGNVTLTVCARSTVTGQLIAGPTVTVTVVDEPNVGMDINWPKEGEEVNWDFDIRGWAIDFHAEQGAGPGFDLVRVVEGNDCEGEVLAETSQRGYDAEFARAQNLDESFYDNVFFFELDDTDPGQLTFTVCVRSDQTGEFVAQMTRTVTVSELEWQTMGLLVPLLGLGFLTLGMVYASRRPLPTFAIFFAFSMVIFLLYWLAFFPGVMSTDSFRQWGQLNGSLPLDNSHPYLHTLWMGLLSFGTLEPAVATFSQLTLAALLFAAISTWFIRRGVPAWLMVPLHAALTLLPNTGYYSITLWKDVSGAHFITALVVGWLVINRQRLAVDRRGIGLVVALGLVTFMAGMVRHNHNILIFLVPLLAWWLTGWPRRLKVIFSTTVLGLFVLAMLPVWGGLIPATVQDERHSENTGFLWLLAHSDYHGSPSLSPEDRAFIRRYIPQDEQTRAAHCRIIYYNRAIGELENRPEDQERLREILADEIANNPYLLGTQRLCNMLSLLGLHQGENDFLYWYPNIAADPNLLATTDSTHIRADSQSEDLHEEIIDILEWSSRSPQHWLFWTYIIPLLLLLVMGMAALYRRQPELGSIFLIYSSLLAVLLFISISRGWRYMYWFSPFTFYALPILLVTLRQRRPAVDPVDNEDA